MTVLEARDIVGGFCTTEELIEEAPGFRFSPTSLDHVLLKVEPSVLTDLGLHNYGLEYIEIDPFYSYVRPDGFSLCFWRDYRRTVEEIAVFSKHDAKQYEYLTKVLMQIWKVGFPYLMGHPLRPSPKTIAKILRHAVPHFKDLMAGGRVVLMSPMEAIDTYFESDEMRVAMATFAASNMFPLEYPGTGIIFSIMALQHGWGVYRAKGGGGEFPKALQRYIEDRGGEVITSAIVEKIQLNSNQVSGVKLTDGRQFKSNQLIGAIDPKNLCQRLLPADSLSGDVYDELDKISASSPNLSTGTISIALDSLPKLPVSPERADDLFKSCMLMAESVESVRQWCIDSQAGILGADMPGWYIFPSYLDRSLVPKGSEGQTIYTYLPAIVKNWRDGSSWIDQEQVHKDFVYKQLEAQMPGIKKSVIGDFMVTPEKLPNFSYNNPKHPFHVDMTLSHMGPWRPTPSLAGYKTPIKGLYHAGAGAHPMGTVNGLAAGSSEGQHYLLRQIQ